MTTAIKSVSVSLDFISLAEKYNISLSEAVRVGLSVILADLGETQFLNRVNLGRKVQALAQLVKEQQEKINKFENGAI